MSINENQKLELFEDFYAWLKNDGLRPKKSERLHKKKIFSNLLQKSLTSEHRITLHSNTLALNI